jgi:hypothetical protein
VRLLHENELLDERHVVRLPFAQDGAHAEALAHVRLLHEDELLDERHVVRLPFAQDGAHAVDLLGLEVLVVQIAPVVVALRLLRWAESVLTGRVN